MDIVDPPAICSSGNGRKVNKKKEKCECKNETG